MSNLNDLIDKTHFDYEQNETKAKELEERILKVPGMSKSYLPKRQYGQQFRGDQLGVTAQSIIVRGDKPLAALFLGLSLKNAASHCLQPQVLSIGKSGIQPIK